MFYDCDIVELKKAVVEEKINTNTELATRSGVDRNTIGAVMSGKKKPSADVMYKLAGALNLTPEQAGRIFFKPNLRNA